MYNLRRISDGKGDQGSMSESINFDIDGHQKIEGNIPIIGNSMKVGSPFAGTYSKQDWWMTTQITNILETIKQDNHIIYSRFSTGNSEYEWWVGEYPKKIESK